MTTDMELRKAAALDDFNSAWRENFGTINTPKLNTCHEVLLRGDTLLLIRELLHPSDKTCEHCRAARKERDDPESLVHVVVDCQHYKSSAPKEDNANLLRQDILMEIDSIISSPLTPIAVTIMHRMRRIINDALIRLENSEKENRKLKNLLILSEHGDSVVMLQSDIKELKEEITVLEAVQQSRQEWSPEQKVSVKALEVALKHAKEGMDETVWLLPIHAERILDLLQSLPEPSKDR